MLSNTVSTIVALAFLAVFCVSLTFDLHGAIAIIAALGFFGCLSAAIGRKHPVLRGVKRVIGGFLMLFALLSYFGDPDQNLMFLMTVALAGVFLCLDGVTLWITDPPSGVRRGAG